MLFAPPLVVTLTGPESTGKSTLAARLGRRFAVPTSAEGARHYVDARLARGESASLSYWTVSPIAREQLALEAAAEREAARLARPLLVRDTDLVSTVAYARHLYGAAPTWVEAAARARRATHYLLCDVDVPWIPQPARDRPHGREALHAEFAAALRALDAHVVHVRGDWTEREATAVAAVEALLAHPAG